MAGTRAPQTLVGDFGAFVSEMMFALLGIEDVEAGNAALMGTSQRARDRRSPHLGGSPASDSTYPRPRGRRRTAESSACCGVMRWTPTGVEREGTGRGYEPGMLWPGRAFPATLAAARRRTGQTRVARF